MSHCFDYTDKRVVITGAYSGVGAALLEVLAELGRPEVVVLDIKQPEGSVAQFIETDMGNASSVDAAIASCRATALRIAAVAASSAPRRASALRFVASSSDSPGSFPPPFQSISSK